MKKVLEVRHLTKRYGQHLALDNVNLTLEKGEVYGLIGRNGAGKTTLIKVITKLIRPSQGSVSLFHYFQIRVDPRTETCRFCD